MGRETPRNTFRDDRRRSIPPTVKYTVRTRALMCRLDEKAPRLEQDDRCIHPLTNYSGFIEDAILSVGQRDV